MSTLTAPRQLKFRAWDPNSKRMMEQPGKVLIRLTGELEYETSPDRLAFGSPDLLVMQFTGLHDKQGKEIYESDIVKVKIDDQYYPFEIVWEDDHMRFGLVDAEGDHEGDSWAFTPKNDFEVIGNIYENPELLKS